MQLYAGCDTAESSDSTVGRGQDRVYGNVPCSLWRGGNTVAGRSAVHCKNHGSNAAADKMVVFSCCRDAGTGDGGL